MERNYSIIQKGYGVHLPLLWDKATNTIPNNDKDTKKKWALMV